MEILDYLRNKGFRSSITLEISNNEIRRLPSTNFVGDIVLEKIVTDQILYTRIYMPDYKNFKLGISNILITEVINQLEYPLYGKPRRVYGNNVHTITNLQSTTLAERIVYEGTVTTINFLDFLLEEIKHFQKITYPYVDTKSLIRHNSKRAAKRLD